jgi:hypothetical protein
LLIACLKKAVSLSLVLATEPLMVVKEAELLFQAGALQAPVIKQSDADDGWLVTLKKGHINLILCWKQHAAVCECLSA